MVVKAICITIVILAVLYLLMIMPRLWKRPDFNKIKGTMFAHRGVHDNGKDAPENSLLAFRRAIDKGYGIELDIQLTKDRIPVVFHDDTITRMTGIKKRVRDLTFAELKKYTLRGSKERIPSLQETLDLVAGKVPLLVEFKEERFDLSLCNESIGLLDKYKGVYIMESFNPMVVHWFKKYRPQIIRGQLSDEFRKEKQPGNFLVMFLLTMLMFNFYARPDFIAYNHRHSSNLSLKLCKHLYKLPVAAYTIKNQFDYDKNRQRFDYLIFDSFIPNRM